MKLPLFWIDAFTHQKFRGNPAAVVISEQPLRDELMQSIAAENNLAETAFVVSQTTGFAIRWFTPTMEVNLCGHATLAAAHALYLSRRASGDVIEFESKGGTLKVTRSADRLALDFPSWGLDPPREADSALIDALNVPPVEIRGTRTIIAVLSNEDDVRSLQPSIPRIAELVAVGVVVTAPGRQCDFVSRFFAPRLGIPEDPVTGATHCALIPYWSQRLGKKRLYAQQVSRRGGELWCEDNGERVSIAGHCALYLTGEIDA
jgi:PhzF family phenazine biosynthesis protein